MDDLGRSRAGSGDRVSPRPERAPQRVVALIVGLIAMVASVPVRSESLDENQLKAAYLYNFARYVEWPQSAHVSNNSALKIGVVGGEAISELLKKTVAGKTVGDRSLRVIDYSSPRQARSSHILFIAGGQSAADLKRTIEDLKGTHVFVVSDADDFAERGGIANFIVSDSRVKFAINERAAKDAGLKVSSKLLRLAELVE